MKEKDLLLINLQLFADDDFDDDDDSFDEIEIEIDGDDDIELDLDADADEDDSESEEGEETEEPKKKEPQKDDGNSTARAVIAERRKWQKKIQELEDKLSSTNHEPDTVIENQLLEAGFDGDTAKVINNILGKSSSKASKVETMVTKKFRDLEFKELSMEPMFSDIDLYREEVENLMDKTGLTAEEAYLAKFGKSKLSKNKSDIEREAEQRVLSNIKKKGNMTFNTISNGDSSSSKTRTSLSKAEMAIAKRAGMTAQQYYAAKNFKTVDKLDKAFNKKKG